MRFIFNPIHFFSLYSINYIFFYFDSIKKIVTSYRVFEKRDSLSSIKAAYSTLSKYAVLPESLKVISDGNPIYNVAVQYWCEHGLPFKLFQVIGLTNLDETSKEYRSQKQIIERHNRTLKYYYRPKGGFTSLDNANSYMILFSTCFNFLRPNSSLDWKTPVELDELKDEVSTGLWDNYLCWAQEAYDNLMQGSNVTNRFLQMAVPQQNTNHQDTKTDEIK